MSGPRLRVLDLFSGIGGFSLGLERAGMRTAAFCEIDPFCRQVLAKHWPKVPCYDDIRNLTGARLAADGLRADVICGGFPCLDISVAGRGVGLTGERSGLWFEYRRIIEEVAPRWVVVENVPALRSRGLDTVLGGLAALGYDAEWHCLPAAAVGAPHRRDRLWLVAYAHHEGRDASRLREYAKTASAVDAGASSATVRPSPDVADTDSIGGPSRPLHAVEGARGRNTNGSGIREDLAHSNGPRLEIQLHGPSGKRKAAFGARWWGIEPDVGRVAYGVPGRVDRLRSLGNAVVPQIPELIGRAIKRAELRHAA